MELRVSGSPNLVEPQPVDHSDTDRPSRTRALPKKLDRLSESNLPFEVLAIVLYKSLPSVHVSEDGPSTSSESCRAYAAAVYSLRSVCARWRDVVDGTPLFWTLVCARMPTEVNSVFLSKSRQEGLMIHCSKPRDSPHEFLQLVNRHRDRWTTAMFEPSSAHRASIARYLTDPAPRLRRLKLVGGIWNSLEPQAPIHLLGGQTHDIRHLDLSQTQVQWFPNPFTGLKSLILREISFQGLTTQYIRDILATSPALEILDLGSIDILPAPIDTRSPPIHFTLLRHLRLGQMSAVIADCILRSIVIEPYSIATIHIGRLRGGPGFDLNGFLMGALPSLSPGYKHLNACCGGSHLQVTRVGTFIWTARSDRGHSFLFDVSNIRVLDGLTWIEQALGVDGPGIWVHLQLNDLASAATEAIPALKTSGAVTGLQLKLDPEEWLLDPLLSAFSGSEGDDSEASADTIPSFPVLRTIHFYEWGWSFDRIEQALQKRFSKRTAMTLPLPDLQVQISYSNYLWTCDGERMLRFDVMQRIKAIDGVRNVRIWTGGPEPGRLAVVWCESLCRAVWG